MSRKIGVCVPFLTPERKDKLLEAAQKHGFEMAFFEANTATEQDVQGCEVLYGAYRREVLKTDKDLKWLHCFFAGVDKYLSDDVYANKDVILTNSSGGYGITISEHVIACVLMLMRHLPQYWDQQKQQVWQPLGQIRAIYGSRVTVVGVGDLGTCIGERMKALGAHVTGVRRSANKPKPSFAEAVYTTDKLNDAVKGADVVALCLPDTEETKQVVTAETFRAMGRNTIFVNVGRGAAVDQKALCDALNNGVIAGAVIDVTMQEPLPKNDPLWQAKNVLITPHVSGNTALPLTCDLLIDIFCENLGKYAGNLPLNNVVNRKLGY